MANMIPDIDPGEIRSEAERALYCQLEASLDDDYDVFHSFAWLRRNGYGDLVMGEADFVLLHHQWGFLVVEVKGGEILRTSNGTWYSTSANGRQYEIRDPYEQAKANMFAIRDKIGAVGIFGKGTKCPVYMGYAVAFPDIDKLPQHLPANADDVMTLTGRDLHRLESRLLEAWRIWANKSQTRAIGRQKAQEIRDKVLAPHFHVVRSKRAQIEQEKTFFKRLTEEQLRVLDCVRQLPRVVVEGGAGTGKTVLAIQQTRRLAAEGHSVLLLCFNIPLASYLRRELDGLPNAMVNSYHHLVESWAREAAIPFEVPRDDDAAEQRFWDEETPVLLLDAAIKLNRRIDALIVDEAQDFIPDWWDSLMALFKDPEQARLLILLDRAQNIYHRPSKLPANLSPIRLDYNCRNTRSINTLMTQLGGVEIECKQTAPQGRPPVFLAWKDMDHQQKLLEEQVMQLVQQENVAPHHIVILSPRRRKNSCCAGMEHIGDIPLVDWDETWPRRDAICWETLRRFKGLEAGIVIIVDVDSRAANFDRRLLYVGVSRAQHHAIILHHAEGKPSGV